MRLILKQANAGFIKAKGNHDININLYTITIAPNYYGL